MDMQSSDLCIPIYLNQQVVFDMLAVLEDGFSSLRTITTSTVEEQTKRSGIGGALGLSNVFALLGVTLGAEGERFKGVEECAQIREERVHTPASLFARLRAAIRREVGLKEITSSETFSMLQTGDFVEFRAVLRKNPLVDVISAVKRLAQLYFLFASEDDQRGSSGGEKAKGAKKGKSQNEQLLTQLEGLLEDLTSTGTLEVIAELVNVPGARAVLSARLDYFLDRAVSEIADGEFYVLGKVVRIVNEGGNESINLLRKTSFGLLQTDVLMQMLQALSDAEKVGLNIPKVIAEVPGPALQVFPIAVFL